jgi:hypothetical protein
VYPRYAVNYSVNGQEDTLYYATYGEAYFFVQVKIENYPVQFASIIRCGSTPRDNKVIEVWHAGVWSTAKGK